MAISISLSNVKFSVCKQLIEMIVDLQVSQQYKFWLHGNLRIDIAEDILYKILLHIDMYSYAVQKKLKTLTVIPQWRKYIDWPVDYIEAERRIYASVN